MAVVSARRCASPIRGEYGDALTSSTDAGRRRVANRRYSMPAYWKDVGSSREHLRRSTGAEAVDCEVAVECENRRALQFVGQRNELSVR